jgi:hypothetical protein
MRKPKIEKSRTIHDKALYLSELGEEFTLTRINSTYKLESEYFGYSQSQGDTRLTPKELGFIKRVKNHIMKNEVYKNFLDPLYHPLDIKYVDVKKRDPETTIDNVIEIDIDEAYWRTSNILGVINDRLYNEGSKQNKTISKLTRLIALGSLAKKIERYKFRGTRLVKHEIIRSTTTQNVWYSICKRVGDLMHEASELAKDNFVLYWVDGIYIKNDPDLVKQIVKIFESNGYAVKFKENLVAKYTEEYVLIMDPANEKQRPFYMSKSDRKKPYFTDKKLKEVAKKYSQFEAIEED